VVSHGTSGDLLDDAVVHPQPPVAPFGDGTRLGVYAGSVSDVQPPATTTPITTHNARTSAGALIVTFPMAITWRYTPHLWW
jgi:hypothetical protein